MFSEGDGSVDSDDATNEPGEKASESSINPDKLPVPTNNHAVETNLRSDAASTGKSTKTYAESMKRSAESTNFSQGLMSTDGEQDVGRKIFKTLHDVVMTISPNFNGVVRTNFSLIDCRSRSQEKRRELEDEISELKRITTLTLAGPSLNIFEMRANAEIRETLGVKPDMDLDFSPPRGSDRLAEQGVDGNLEEAKKKFQAQQKLWERQADEIKTKWQMHYVQEYDEYMSKVVRQNEASSELLLKQSEEDVLNE
jgi:hypothetical protein